MSAITTFEIALWQEPSLAWWLASCPYSVSVGLEGRAGRSDWWKGIQMCFVMEVKSYHSKFPVPLSSPLSIPSCTHPHHLACGFGVLPMILEFALLFFFCKSPLVTLKALTEHHTTLKQE
jgi:hypothetical protein